MPPIAEEQLAASLLSAYAVFFLFKNNATLRWRRPCVFSAWSRFALSAKSAASSLLFCLSLLMRAFEHE